MFAVYTHDSSTTQANLVNDIVLILTGTTNTASLSADCVTASTSITTTYDSAGWTLHDGSTGSTNLQIVKALQQDGVTYKYVGINATSTTALKITVYEGWDAATNTPTNAVDSNSIAWSSSTQQPLYIYATQQQILIGCQTTPSSGTFASPCMALEIDNTNGSFIAGYPTTFTFQTANDLSVGQGPRIKHPNGTGDLTTSSTIFMTNINADGNNNFQKGRLYRDASENVSMGLVKMSVIAGYNQTLFYYGAFGTILGKMRVGSAVLNTAVTLDTVVIGATTYVAFYIETGNSVLGSSIWVPQG
jgi:hypothetical protein